MDFIPNNVKVLLDVRIYKQDKPGSTSSSSSTGQGYGQGYGQGIGSSSQGQGYGSSQGQGYGSNPSVARGIDSSFGSGLGSPSSLSKGLTSNNMFGGSVRQDIIPYRPNMTFQNLNTDTVLFDPLVKITDATIKSAGKYTQLQFLVPDQFNELILKMNRQSGNASKTFFYTELDKGPIRTAILENNTITIKPLPVQNIQDISLSTLMKPSLVYTRLNNASKVTQDKDEFKNDDKYTTFISINSVDNSKLIITNDSKKNRQAFDVKIAGTTIHFYSKSSLELLLDATKDGTVSNNMKLTMDNLFALNSKMFLDSSELSIYKQSQSNWLYNLSNNYDTLYKERFLFKHKLNPNYFDRLKYNIIRQLEVYYKDNESALKEYDKTNNTVKEVFSNNYSVVSSGVRKIITQEFNKFLSEMIVKDFPSIDYFIKYKEYLIKEYKNIVDLDDKNIPVEIRFTGCPDFYIYSFKWNKEAYTKSPQIRATVIAHVNQNQTDVDRLLSKIYELNTDDIDASTNNMQEFITDKIKENKCLTSTGNPSTKQDCKKLQLQFNTKLDEKYNSYTNYISNLNKIISLIIDNDNPIDEDDINDFKSKFDTLDIDSANSDASLLGGTRGTRSNVVKSSSSSSSILSKITKERIDAENKKTENSHQKILDSGAIERYQIEYNQKQLTNQGIKDIKKILARNLIDKNTIETANLLLEPYTDLKDICDKIPNDVTKYTNSKNINELTELSTELREYNKNKTELTKINLKYQEDYLNKLDNFIELVQQNNKKIAEAADDDDAANKRRITAAADKIYEQLKTDIKKNNQIIIKIEHTLETITDNEKNENAVTDYVKTKTDTIIQLIILKNKTQSPLIKDLLNKLFNEWKDLIILFYDMKKHKDLYNTPFIYSVKDTIKHKNEYLTEIYKILLKKYAEKLVYNNEINRQLNLTTKSSNIELLNLLKETHLPIDNKLLKNEELKQTIITNKLEQNENLKKENKTEKTHIETDIQLYTEKLKGIEQTVKTPEAASAPEEGGPVTRLDAAAIASANIAAQQKLVDSQQKLADTQLQIELKKQLVYDNSGRDDTSPDSSPRGGGSKQNGGATTNESTLTLRLQNYFKLYSPYQEEICKAANCDITKSNPNDINVVDKDQNYIDRQNFFGSIYTAITEYNALPTSSSTQIKFIDGKNKDIPGNFKTFLEKIYEDITSKFSGSGQKLDEIYNEKLKKYLPTKNNKTSELEYLDLLKKNPDKIVQSFEKGLLPYEPNIGNLDTDILKLNQQWHDKFNLGEYYLDDISTKPIYNILRQILSINLIVIDNTNFKLTTCDDLRDSSKFVIFLLQNKDKYFLISYQNKTAYYSNNFKISLDKISQLGLSSPPLFIYLYIVNSCVTRDYENQFGDFYTTVIKSQLDGKNKRLFADYISKIKEGIVKINANAIISNTTSSLSSTNLAITKSTYCYYITVTLDLYEGKLPFMQKQTMGCEIKRQNIITDFTELTGIKLLPSIAENKYLSLLPQDAPKPSWLTSITSFFKGKGAESTSTDATANANKGKTASTPSATALNKPRRGGGGTRRKIILTYKRQNNIKNVKNVRNMKEIKARLSRKLHNITHKLFKS